MKPQSQQGLFQALGVTVYCTLVGLLMFNGEKIFGKMDSFVGPIMFLVLLSLSVLICGLLVFYKPYKLFIDGKKKEAAEVVLSTVGYLFVFLLILLLIVLFS